MSLVQLSPAHRPVRNAEIAALVEYWHATAERHGLPTRRTFEPFRLTRWLGHLSIYEPIDAGADFLIRLDGTEIVHMVGEDWTGRRASEVDRVYDKGLCALMQRAYRLRAPIVESTQLFQKDHVPSTRAVLPIAGDDGLVAQIFLCLVVDEARLTTAQ